MLVLVPFGRAKLIKSKEGPFGSTLSGGPFGTQQIYRGQNKIQELSMTLVGSEFTLS